MSLDHFSGTPFYSDTNSFVFKILKSHSDALLATFDDLMNERAYEDSPLLPFSLIFSSFLFCLSLHWEH